MKELTLSFTFSTVEELHEFTSRVASAGGIVSAPTSAEDNKPKKTRGSSKTTETQAPTSSFEASAQSSNPFQGANMGQNSTPPAAGPAKPAFDRKTIEDTCRKFVGDHVALGVDIQKIAEIMNQKYFLPRGIPQVKVSDLNDFQLEDFFRELNASIAPEVKKLIPAPSLV